MAEIKFLCPRCGEYKTLTSESKVFNPYGSCCGILMFYIKDRTNSPHSFAYDDDTQKEIEIKSILED